MSGVRGCGSGRSRVLRVGRQGRGGGRRTEICGVLFVMVRGRRVSFPVMRAVISVMRRMPGVMIAVEEGSR
jgi:hypothetical protein